MTTPPPSTQRAVRIHKFGGPEELVVETVPVPAPGPGQVLIRQEAVGVNFIDIYQRTGLYPVELPAILGQEGAGIVVTTGTGVSTPAVGRRVAYCGTLGAYAPYTVVDASRVIPLPDTVDANLGAAVMLQGLTAHYLTSSTFPLTREHRCLVHAAAGGVGLLLVQLAKLRGAFVIATTSTAEKAELVRGAGADEVINYQHEDFSARTREITGGRGVDVVYDSVGKATFLGSLDALGRRGMLVSFGQASGAVPPFDILLLSKKPSLFVTRPRLADYIASREELEWRAGELFSLVGLGRLSVRIGSTFPLERANQAQEALASRKTAGKLLLLPENS